MYTVPQSLALSLRLLIMKVLPLLQLVFLNPFSILPENSKIAFQKCFELSPPLKKTKINQLNFDLKGTNSCRSAQKKKGD